MEEVGEWAGPFSLTCDGCLCVVGGMSPVPSAESFFKEAGSVLLSFMSDTVIDTHYRREKLLQVAHP